MKNNENVVVSFSFLCPEKRASEAARLLRKDRSTIFVCVGKRSAQIDHGGGGAVSGTEIYGSCLSGRRRDIQRKLKKRGMTETRIIFTK